MPTWWHSLAYRHVYEDLVKQMDPSSIRDKCFARVLITPEQKDVLSELTGAKHNRSLLSLVEKLNNDQYEVFCQVLLDNAVHVHDDSVAEMRKASVGAAASASTHSQAAAYSATSHVEGNPFQTEEYAEIRMELVANLDMSDFRNRAEGYCLVTPAQVDSLSTTFEPKGRVAHNRELFRIMETGGPKAIRKFSDKLLPKLGQAARYKADLDRLLAMWGIFPVARAPGRAETRTGGKTEFTAAVQRDGFVSTSSLSSNLPSSALVSRDRKVNGWDSVEYRENFAKLIERMHPDYIKNHCYSLGLLSEYDMEDITAKVKRSDKNGAILGVLRVSGGKFGVFRELLHISNDCRDIAEQLDAVGPDRTKDQRCLAAKATLQRMN